MRCSRRITRPPRSCARWMAVSFARRRVATLLRTPDILPTGRNLARVRPLQDSQRLCLPGWRESRSIRLIARHAEDGQRVARNRRPRAVGNGQSEDRGCARSPRRWRLLGTAPRFDSFGRLAGARLIPLAELGRPAHRRHRHDVGYFSRFAATCRSNFWPRPPSLRRAPTNLLDQNFIRKHALAYQAEHGCDMETASLRVFGNADGAYGSNVNNLLESGRWEDEDELAETYTRRKGLRLRPRRPPGGTGCAAAPASSPKSISPIRISIPSNSA